MIRTEGALQYLDNSSERAEIWDSALTREGKWADAAYQFISHINCNDGAEAFFTTKRECKDLVLTLRYRMNVYIASPSIFGDKYKAFLPDEPLTRSDSHDAVIAVDPFPLANFGHLVIVFYVDMNSNYNECIKREGIYVGSGECMTLALRKRCKNALERRSRRRNFAKRCEINFLPVVQIDKSDIQIELMDGKRENHLTCKPNLAGYGQCPHLRTVEETSGLICNPFRDNTKRCSTTHETVHTSCRMFEICDQAVIISGGWNRQTTGTRHKRNVELFYWMLRENGFKKRNIKIFFANGAEGIHIPGEDIHQVLPSAMKLAFRYHLQTLCGTRHCVDSLVLYLNSPTKLDGTLLLWDVDGNGMAEESETYSLEELKYDIKKCLARKVHIVIDQSYAGEIAQAFKNSDDHKNVIVFASGKDHEYSYNDDYTLHWVKANHKQDCTRQVHEHSSNEIKGSSPIMKEGEQGKVKTTIFGAPCDATPEFSDQELREHYLGCQNLPTAEWLSVLVDDKRRKRR